MLLKAASLIIANSKFNMYACLIGTQEYHAVIGKAYRSTFIQKPDRQTKILIFNSFLLKCLRTQKRKANEVIHG